MTLLRITTLFLCFVCCAMPMLSVAQTEQMPGATETLDAAATPSVTPTIESLLQKLVKARLSKAGAVIEEIEALGGASRYQLYSTMLQGDLYYIRDSLRVIALTKNAQGEKEGSDILTGDSLGVFEKKQVKKIRVNNRLRGMLRDAMARDNLLYGSKEERRNSALYFLENIDTKNVAALKVAQDKEKNVRVKDAIDIALALYDLKNSDNTDTRLASLTMLSGKLESTVRNELVRLTAKDEAGEYIEHDKAVRNAAAKELKRIDSRIGFYRFIEQLFFGLSAGSVLLLAAIGLAITFGVMGVINMAHGEMIMLGAYTTYVIQLIMPNFLEYSIFIAIPAAFMVSALVGMVIEYLVIRRLHGRPLETLLATFGISLILQQAVRTIFSPLNRQVSTPEWMSGFWEVNPVLAITYNRLYILIFSLIVFVVLLGVLKKTSLGLRVRAVSQNRAMAKSLGVRTAWVDSMTFALGSGIAGVAGVALSQITNVGPNLGQGYIIDSFMVVVFGGVGNILGTFFGAFSLGVANKFLEPVTGAVLAKILVLVFIILFIQRRPKGLFPQKGRAAE